MLIVDDDKRLVRSLKRFFDKQGEFQVETATSGFSAGSAFERLKPDAILLDIMLGDIDGRELFKRMKADREFKDTKVIALSGYIKDEEVPDLMRLGFHDYVSKPFAPDELMSKLEKLLGRSVRA